MRILRVPAVLACAATALLSLTAFAGPASAADDLLWVRQIGSAAADEMSGISIGPDDDIYTSGRFSGTVDFDPEGGVTNLTAIGTNDVYVTRFDRDGRLVWARQIGGAGGSVGVAVTGSIASDGGNALYVTGNFSGTVDFDPGPGVFEMTAIGTGANLFVARLTMAGDLVWARQITCADGSGAGPLAIAANGTRVALTGTLSGTCDFDPGPGTADVTATLGMGTGTPENVFVAALDGAGGFAWAAPFESTGSDIPNGVTIDASGDVVTVGRARGEIDYDPGPGTDLQTGDFFVIKQSPTGTVEWARAIGSSSVARAFGVATDAAGAVYVAGQFMNSIDFDPGPGTAVRTATAGGLLDGFILKLDAGGSFSWADVVGNTLTDVARKVVVAPNGKVHVIGQFSGTVDFDPGAATFNLTSAGSSDGFVLTLDSAGQFVRALRVGGTQADPMLDVALDHGGRLVAFGTFSGSADFDPGPGTSILNSAGSSDVFVWKYGCSELRLEGAGAGPTTIAFSPGSPALFDLLRGRLSDLRGSGNYAQAACLGGFLNAPATDAGVPDAGDGFYYLARGRNCCGAEGYGDSTMVPDPRDALDLASACP
jgi:hypothetical protein